MRAQCGRVQCSERLQHTCLMLQTVQSTPAAPATAPQLACGMCWWADVAFFPGCVWYCRYWIIRNSWGTYWVSLAACLPAGWLDGC